MINESHKLSSIKKVTYYLVLPLVVSLILLFFNYSGIPLLQNIIAPQLNREFGLVENLQLIVILLIVLVVWKGFRIRKHPLEKIAYGFLTLFFILAFLEEIDYGLHYYEFFFNEGIEDKSRVRNFHNQPGHNFWVRQIIIIVMLIVFVIFPLLKNKITNRVIKYFCADKMIIASFAVYLLVAQLARIIPQIGGIVNEPLRGNHQEFEELVSYYIMFLYFLELVFHKNALFSVVINQNK